jgi:hypothetical protein
MQCAMLRMGNWVLTLCGVLGLMLWPPNSSAFVDPTNANYTWTWNANLGAIAEKSFSISYNSRSLFYGMFGFGWCSDLETQLKVKLNGDFEMADCGSGSVTRFTLVRAAERGVGADPTVPDPAEVISRRGHGKKYTNFMTGEEVALEHAANVRQLLNAGVLADDLLKEVGLTAPALGAGDYRSDDGSSASFDGEVIRVSRVDGQRRSFNADGELIDETNLSGNRLTIVSRSARAWVFDVRGVRATLELNAQGRADRLRVGERIVGSFRYALNGDVLTLETIRFGTQSESFKYDGLLNLTERSKSGRRVEVITYDRTRDWVLSAEDVESGCTERFLYWAGIPPKPLRNDEHSATQTFQQVFEQRLPHLAMLQRYPTDNKLVSGDFLSTLTNRTCKDRPKVTVTVGAQAFVYAKKDGGAQHLVASATWFESAGTSFVEYRSSRKPRAITQPPIALRSTLRPTTDSDSQLMTNSLFSVDYVEPSNCGQALTAQGLILLREPLKPVLFQARALRSNVDGECLIRSIEWQTRQGKVRIDVERDSKGASNAVVIDGRERWRHAASTNQGEPSTCSLRAASRETEPDKIHARANAALSAICSSEHKLTQQAALVFSLIQNQYTCGCGLGSTVDHKVADFARWIVRGDFVVDRSTR